MGHYSDKIPGVKIDGINQGANNFALLGESVLASAGSMTLKDFSKILLAEIVNGLSPTVVEEWVNMLSDGVRDVLGNVIDMVKERIENNNENGVCVE